MQKLEMFVDDMKPDLVLRLLTGPDAASLTPVDLTAATSITIIGILGSRTVMEGSPDDSSAVDGEVTWYWKEDNTSVPGDMEFVVKVVWPDDKPQTFKVDGTVRIVGDYGR